MPEAPQDVPTLVVCEVPAHYPPTELRSATRRRDWDPRRMVCQRSTGGDRGRRFFPLGLRPSSEKRLPRPENPSRTRFPGLSPVTDLTCGGAAAADFRMRE